MHAGLYEMQAKREELEQKATEQFAKFMDENGPPLIVNGVKVPWGVMAGMDRKGFIERYMPALIKADATKEVAAGKEAISAPQHTVTMLSKVNNTLRQEFAPSGVLLEQAGPDGKMTVNLEAQRAAQSNLEKQAAAENPRAKEILATIKANDDHIQTLSRAAINKTQAPETIAPPTAAPTSAASAPQVMPLPPGIPEGSTIVPGKHINGKTIYMLPTLGPDGKPDYRISPVN